MLIWRQAGRNEPTAADQVLSVTGLEDKSGESSLCCDDNVRNSFVQILIKIHALLVNSDDSGFEGQMAIYPSTRECALT